MKVGRDPARDCERVSLARAAIGPDCELFVDANGAYERKQALAMAEGFADEQVSWFEEPVSSDDLAGDAGIWEGREGERHYTSSKLMCWVALDRAVKLAPQLGDGVHPGHWEEQRDELRAAILEQAYDEQSGVYAGAFGSDRLDASVLLMATMCLVAADDERMLATIYAIDRELGVNGLVRRWSGTSDD